MTQPDTRPQSSGLDLSAKMGPLPVWGWIALAAAGGVGVLLWLQSRKNAAAAGTTGTTTEVQGADAATVANLQDQLATVEAQIRDTQGSGSTAQPTAPNSNLPSNTHVLAGWSVYKFLNDLNTGLPANIKVTYQDLLAANPGLANSINNSDPAKPTFKTETTLNLPPFIFRANQQFGGSS
jgi:cytoskeletal protein RodZ